MYPLVRTLYTTPAMNTCSKKQFIRENIHTPPIDHMDNNYYLYTLPTWLQELGQIVILDAKITDYDLVHYLPVLTANQRDKRKSKRQQKALERCREWLMAVARNMHMFMQGLSRDGQIEIKVESEASSLVIMKESITPKLEYPMLPPVSPDPNNYWWKFGIETNKILSSIHLGDQASACVSPFQIFSHHKNSQLVQNNGY